MWHTAVAATDCRQLQATAAAAAAAAAAGGGAPFQFNLTKEQASEDDRSLRESVYRKRGFRLLCMHPPPWAGEKYVQYRTIAPQQQSTR